MSSSTQQELEDQQQIAAQPLKEAVDGLILNALAPQERARHLQRLPAHLEK